MTMDPRPAEQTSGQESRRETDRFYGERRSGVGLYAEISPREERRAIAFDASERGE